MQDVVLVLSSESEEASREDAPGGRACITANTAAHYVYMQKAVMSERKGQPAALGGVCTLLIGGARSATRVESFVLPGSSLPPCAVTRTRLARRLHVQKNTTKRPSGKHIYGDRKSGWLGASNVHVCAYLLFSSSKV
jgi:hypothetical protein